VQASLDYQLPGFWTSSDTRCSALLGYRVLGRYRRLTLSNLELALGDSTTPEERESIAKESFVNVAYSFMELMFMEKILDQWEERVIPSMLQVSKSFTSMYPPRTGDPL